MWNKFNWLISTSARAPRIAASRQKSHHYYRTSMSRVYPAGYQAGENNNTHSDALYYLNITIVSHILEVSGFRINITHFNNLLAISKSWLSRLAVASLFQTGLNDVPFGHTPWTAKDSLWQSKTLNIRLQRNLGRPRLDIVSLLHQVRGLMVSIGLKNKFVFIYLARKFNSQGKRI